MFRIAIGHPGMGFGGSEARVMNLLELLQDDYRVEFITTNTPDIDKLNSAYHTAVKKDRVRIRSVPVPFFMRGNLRYSALRGALYNRFCRKTGEEYDLCISAYNFTDWGKCRAAVQYIADFVWDWELNCEFNPTLNERNDWRYKRSILRRAYIALCDFIGGARRTQSFLGGGDILIANSDWTNRIFKEKYGIDCHEIIYPAVRTDFPVRDWESRSGDFISIGRIAHEKSVIEQIEIMEKVRAEGFDLKFNLVGKILEDSYGMAVRAKAAGKPWLIMHGAKYGKEKAELLTDCRFAINGCANESFGISVAEFVLGGCIPFVPDGGGQTEIVPFAELRYGNTDEAAKKIVKVLSDPELLENLKKKLRKLSCNFTAETFKLRSLEVIKKLLNARP